MLDNTLENLDAQLGADERFLVAAIAVFFHSGEPVPAVKELASCLHISQKYVARGLKKLASRDFLSVDLMPATDRGRPSHLFKLTSRFSRWLHETVKPEAWTGQEATLKAVLSGDLLCAEEDAALSCQKPKVGFARPPVRTKSSVLLVTSRLIMAVLISKSDELGWVSGVTMSELAKMAGVPTSSIRNHIQELRKRKRVFDYVSGLSSKWFQCSKIANTYYLNLESFSRCGPSYGVFLFEDDGGQFEQLLKISSNAETRKVLSMMRPAEIAVLMARLLKEVSNLLSTEWWALGSPQNAYEKCAVSSGLLKRVARIVNVPVDVKMKAGWPASAKERIEEDLSFFIVWAACVVKKIISDSTLGEASFEKVQVRPIKRLGKRFFIQIDFIASGTRGGRVIFLS